MPSPPSLLLRSRRLTTPEIASDPYWAAAPSRSTSMLLTMAAGMVFMSTADEPRPMVPFTFTSDEEWRRLELTSTRVWSGPMPRRVAGRMVSVPSARPGRGKFSDGNAIASAWLISVVPAFFSDSAEMISTGEVVSRAVRLATRVPVTITVAASGCGSVWALAPLPMNSEAIEMARMCFLGVKIPCI